MDRTAAVRIGLRDSMRWCRVWQVAERELSVRISEEWKKMV